MTWIEGGDVQHVAINDRMRVTCVVTTTTPEEIQFNWETPHLEVSITNRYFVNIEINCCLDKLYI